MGFEEANGPKGARREREVANSWATCDVEKWEWDTASSK